MKKNVKTKHEFAFVIFIDPMYHAGWVDRKELPEKKDAIHIGVGTIVEEDDKSVTFCFAEGLTDTEGDVMHPQLIHRECFIKFYRFDEDLFYAIFKGRAIKRLQGKIRKEVDNEVADYC
jgi:hypothetical protein